jgi:hypothetical protein
VNSLSMHLSASLSNLAVRPIVKLHLGRLNEVESYAEAKIVAIGMSVRTAKAKIRTQW